MSKRGRANEVTSEWYVEQRLLLGRVRPEPEHERERDDEDDDEDELEELEEEERDEDEMDDEEQEGVGRHGRGKPMSSSLFAQVVAMNGEAEFLEQRVRTLAARLAPELPDEDAVFGIPFAEANSQDRLRYCNAVIPLLLERIARLNKKEAQQKRGKKK